MKILLTVQNWSPRVISFPVNAVIIEMINIWVKVRWFATLLLSSDIKYLWRSFDKKVIWRKTCIFVVILTLDRIIFLIFFYKLSSLLSFSLVKTLYCCVGNKSLSIAETAVIGKHSVRQGNKEFCLFCLSSLYWNYSTLPLKGKISLSHYVNQCLAIFPQIFTYESSQWFRFDYTP